MRPIVLAPAAFKGALPAPAAARALATGVALAAPDAEIRIVPVADGGEGTMDALLESAPRGAARRTVRVHDPLHRPVDAEIGLLADGTAVVELARASGFERLRPSERDPEATSTYGTGELIRAALDAGTRRVIVGVGGSATCDGGLGLVRALGARILDTAGRELAGTGADMARVARIDLDGLDPRLAGVDMRVACDVMSPFAGDRGAARIFGPQKGASAEAVERLDAGMRRVEALYRAAGRADPGALPGSGAAGGAAGGMAALLGARLEAGAPLVLEALRFRERLRGAGLCITGEGSLDGQTAEGKAPAAVARVCRDEAVPCVAVCGRLGLLPGLVRRMGLVAAFPIGREARPLAEALAGTADDLAAMGAALAGMARALDRSSTDGGPPTHP